jgi:PAS domain S-box-containing protein
MDLLLQIFSVPSDPSLMTVGTYDPGLVALSVAISIFASLMALHIAGQAVGATSRVVRAVALLSGTLALGAGVWAMHFIGMLAFNLCTQVTYDPVITIASMLPSLAASFVALTLLARPRIGAPELLSGGVLVGAGIGGMHYTGMAAMQLPLAQRYDPAMFSLSILVAVVLAVLALWVRYGLIDFGARLTARGRLAVSAVMMGCAISGMHYTAMAAARFVGKVTSTVGGTANADFIAIAVALTTVVLTVLVLGANGLIQYREMVRNLSENESRRKAIEQALRNSEEQFRSLIGNIPGISYRALVAPELTLVFVSDAIAELTGFPAADFQDPDRKRPLIDLVHREDRDRVASEIAGAIDAGRSFLVEFRLGHRDGSIRWMWCNGNVVRDDAGRPKWLDGVILDISERHRMEQELRVAKERAEQAAAARTAFMANMSHEIRTPMNAILGFTDVLLQSRLESEQRRYLETVRSSGRSLLRLLNEILDTAKLDKGVVELEMAAFDLLRLIDELSSTLGAAARAKGIALVVRYDQDLPHWFKGDELRIRQILTNLVSNAIKFTEAGNVTLSVAPRQGNVHFAVSDTGIGIAADRLQAIFDPFTQADVSMSRRFGGTGLGTTISKKLTELMGGRIWVESALGLGSTFHALVPLEAAEQRHPEARLPRSNAALPPLRILVADDVPQNLELLTLLLGKQGHSIATVKDGDLALEAVGRTEFDLILMDMQMPGTDGPGACRQIRAAEARHGTKRVPIIALTASVLEADRQAAREAGMDGFASKPVDLYELSAEIARVLGLKSGPQGPAGSGSGALHVLDSARGLTCWAGEQEAYHLGLRRFAAEQAGAAEALQRLSVARDHAGGRALAHRVKGLAANLGLQRLAAVLAQYERCITGGQLDELGSLLTQASGELEDALRAIRSQIDSVAPVADAARAAPPLDVDRIRNLGDGLMRSLGRGALDDKSLAELTAMLGTHVEANRLARLSDAIEDFDFESARAMVATMLESFNEADHRLPRS